MVTLIANLGQSLVIAEETGGVQSDLLKDGGEIQRVISDLHGRQRHRLGWSAEQVAREYEVLGETIDAFISRSAGSQSSAATVLRRLLTHAAETSDRAYRHAAQ